MLCLLPRLLPRLFAEQIGLPRTVGIYVVGAGLLLLGVVLYRRWALRATSRWTQQHGWAPVATMRDWPWTTVQPGVPTPSVQYAWSKTVNGFQVTVGEVIWEPSGMLDIAGPAKGRGTFAVLQLPRQYPRLGVRRKLRPDPLQPERDEFSRQYWTICVDAASAVNLISDAIKQAHTAGDFPDWLLVGDQIYIVTRHSGPTTPVRTKRAIQHVQRIADLLGLTRD